MLSRNFFVHQVFIYVQVVIFENFGVKTETDSVNAV